MQETEETRVWPQGWEGPLKEGFASRFSILAWRIPWTEEPGGLQSIRSRRIGHDWSDVAPSMNRSCIHPWPVGCHIHSWLLFSLMYWGGHNRRVTEQDFFPEVLCLLVSVWNRPWGPRAGSATQEKGGTGSFFLSTSLTPEKTTQPPPVVLHFIHASLSSLCSFTINTTNTAG